MECNKDEAVRAKQIAEKMMKSNDFERARKIALNAQNLYPNLENISQLVSICDVHCSAQKRMMGEKDWYGILQVEKLADELTIKKQYRRLALHLHPDKNQFPGAEVAFKLICEAKAVLSDPTKRSSYDSKISADKPSSGDPPPQRTGTREQDGVQNNVSSSPNQNQATQSSASVKQEVFWTRCPFCSVRYQYYRKFVNTTLYCKKCSKQFMGYEISVQGVPAGSDGVGPSAKHVPSKVGVGQSAGVQENRTDQVKFTAGVQNNNGSTASHAETQQSARDKPLRPESCDMPSSDNSDKHISVCDSEFNDFEGNRDEGCFAVNQYWALYDDLDDMPRFYAKVKEVRTSPFELSITWLVADPINDVLAKWVEEDLPAGCGSFKLGETEKTSLQKNFSHQMHCLEGKNRGSLVIYPRKGEVWALFKDWDISWSSEPKNHKEFKYEIVEILADFDAVAGIKVSYLYKLRGFVSIFQRSSQSETDYFLIGPNELYRFSHLVPYFKMRGTEREGVPVDSLELDPASLPQNFDDLQHPSRAKSKLEDVPMEDTFCDPLTDLNSRSSCARFQQGSPRKREHVSYNEVLDDLPSPLKRPYTHKISEENGNGQKAAFTDGVPEHDHQNCFPTEAYSKSETKEMGTVDKEVNSKREANGMSGTGADTVEIKSDKGPDSRYSDNSDKQISVCDSEFNDFEGNRDEGCFAVNQYWALYDDLDDMPRFYAKVKKVHTSPFELSITWLVADPIDDVHAEWVEEHLPAGCGSFKLGETEKTSRRLSFSHQMHCLKGKKNGSLVIYPRKREVWALFKDWDLSWSFEPEKHKKFKYEIVEVLADFDSVAGIKVTYLDKIRGFVSLFKRSSQSETDSFLIGPDDLYKFSHLVPSFKMRGASFELDPASLPENPDDLYYPGRAKMESENMDPDVVYISPMSATKMRNFVNSESS